MSNKKRPSKKKSSGNYNAIAQEYKSFASASAGVGSSSSKPSSKGITEERLKNMLNDPSKNAPQIASLSSRIKVSNGMYKRVINYLSSILTYDHMIYPVFDNPHEVTGDMSEMKMAYAQTAVFIDRLNPKFHLPIFAEKILTNGSVYLYKLDDSKGVAYQEFPISYCRISYIENGVYRYQIDISKISEKNVSDFPKEVQSAYSSFKNGNKEKLKDGKWHQVTEKGVAFTMDVDVLSQGGLSLPSLASSLIDAIKIENAKQNMESDSELDNTKIVHSKIETDDKGRPTMELPVVREYHNAVKKALPKGAVAITNPFDTKGMTLDGTGKNGKFALLDKATDQFFKGTGVSAQLFADDNSSSQALERSIQVDSQWLFSFLLPMFTNYYNYELKKATKKKSTWKIKFMYVSHFDRDEAIKTAKDQLSFGGSRLEYLAYTGMTPLEVANVLVFEQTILTIDDFMVAKQTSHTMGADSEKSEEQGRPPSDDPTDTTVRIKDSE
ncbi:hypothetical protein RVS70_05620 [Virgibacillus sp. M23]|uniref:hypothetical protein n=1 Tax=Virgibacillus sp. M23 TaxID=3079030 RepID=UPI002A90B9B7|nr:hypothetical protein [Virgibacillus sp. M23]MDY7043679.1 hypothetical protein [Virgibacillus sp. M23]